MGDPDVTFITDKTDFRELVGTGANTASRKLLYFATQAQVVLDQLPQTPSSEAPLL